MALMPEKSKISRGAVVLFFACSWLASAQDLPNPQQVQPRGLQEQQSPALADQTISCTGKDIKRPKPLHTPDPKPFKPYRGGIVVLQIVIGTDGRIHDPKVTQSLSREADDSALAVLPRWTFKPATKNGQPVACQMKLEMAFPR